MPNVRWMKTQYTLQNIVNAFLFSDLLIILALSKSDTKIIVGVAISCDVMIWLCCKARHQDGWEYLRPFRRKMNNVINLIYLWAALDWYPWLSAIMLNPPGPSVFDSTMPCTINC